MQILPGTGGHVSAKGGHARSPCQTYQGILRLFNRTFGPVPTTDEVVAAREEARLYPLRCDR